MLEKLRHRFLSRLAAPEDATERVRTERVLASARLFLTLTALIAVYMDPTEPTRYAELAYGILIAYFVWGVYAWIHVHRREEVREFASLIHFLDIAFPMTFILFTAGPNSPFFVFLLFVLTAAAFRWGFPETMMTACVVAALLVVEAALLSYGPRTGWIEGQYEVNRFVIRVSYLLTLGLLVGYLGEEEKQWRAENSTISRLLSKVHEESGLRSSMQLVLSETVRIFAAHRALVTLKQVGTNQIFVWRLPARDAVVHVTQIETEARENYEAGVPAGALYATRRSRNWRCWAVTPEGRRMRLPSSFDPGVLPGMNGARSVWAVTLDVGEEWSGSVLLYDGITGPDVSSELRFMRNLMRQIGPALYTVFLLRRLRSRAGAFERARVARDLHDGAIQALISVEMQIDVLRRQLTSPEKSANVAPGLTHVQELVRQQVLDLRMLMQQMKPVEFSPGQLLDYMAEMVDRFRRDTGIGAQFVTTLEDVQMPSRVSREVARILQEALVNIRKHSGATDVQVRFAAEHGCWKLGIVDNGRGFDFSGRFNLKELDAPRLGARVL
jgi:signal transduction histidine kinase